MKKRSARRITSRSILSTLLVLLFTLAGNGCTAFDALDAAVPTFGYNKSLNIPYGSLPSQKLDVYTPSFHNSGDVVIFVHGGHWQSGDKSNYRFVAQALTSRGFVTVVPNYRMYPKVTFPRFVEDGADAVKWVHDNISKFGGNPGRVFLMGHSAGAHIVALLTLDRHYLHNVGLTEDAIRGTVALSGPYDFVPPNKDRAAFNMSPTDRAPSDAAEPIHFVDGHAPPMLLIHGLEDKTVEPGNARRLADAIISKGGSVQLITYPHQAHVGVILAFAFPFPFRCIAPVLRDSTRFFHQH